MSSERDLSESRIPAQTRKLNQQAITSFEAGRLPEVGQELQSIVLDYNFDTLLVYVFIT